MLENPPQGLNKKNIEHELHAIYEDSEREVLGMGYSKGTFKREKNSGYLKGWQKKVGFINHFSAEDISLKNKSPSLEVKRPLSTKK